MCDSYGYGFGDDASLGIDPLSAGATIGKAVFGKIFGGGLAPQKSTLDNMCPSTPTHLLEPIALYLSRHPSDAASLRARLQEFKHMNKPVATAADTSDPAELAAVGLWWAWGGYDCEVGNAERGLQTRMRDYATKGAREVAEVPSRTLVELPSGAPIRAAGAPSMPAWLLPVLLTGGAALLLARKR